MKNFSLIFLLIFGIFSAQNRSFFYKMDYKINPKKDSATHEEMVLDIQNGKSIFRKVQQKKYDSIYATTGNNPSLTMGFEHQFYILKDYKKQEILKILQNFQDNFALKIDEKIDWKISPEKKKIDKFNCQKATANYGGRSWTAWFATEIPMQDGPYVFGGLPGLIVEIYDDKNEYHFTLTEIKNSGNNLYFTRKTLPINWKTFTKLTQEYYDDPYKNTKPNSAGLGGNVKVKYTDENGKEFVPDFKEWTENKQNTIRRENNPIELNHKINYK